ncbi:multidrug-resistance type transporter aminotriazole resistance [Fusarium falciforme]
MTPLSDTNLEVKPETESPRRTPSQLPQDVESSSQSDQDKNLYPADALSTPRQILFVGTLCTAMFTNQVGLGNTLATVGLIGESFGITNPGQLSWLIAGYSLTLGTFILIGGRLGDEFGHKKMFVIGMIWYSLWSLVAGLSVYSNYVLFTFSRVFQGMGPALTLPNALGILGRSFAPGPRQNMAFAWFGGTAPFGAIAGFLFGGLFALAWWPWIYWSLAIALAGIAAFAEWTIPRPLQERQNAPPLRNRLEALDIPGGLTGVTALVLFNFAWNQAVVVGWKQPYVYICLILGVLFGTVFFCIEIYWSKSPLLPLASFNSDIGFVFACTATGWACFGIWVYYIGQVALDIGGNTPLQIAAWFVPVIPVGLVSALAVGKLMGRIPASWIMVVGQVAYLVGSILAATRPPHSTYWTYYFFSVLIITVGMDTSFPSAVIIFSNAVPREYQGMGASVVLTIINYSISIGLGFAGTVETNINNTGKNEQDKLLGYRGALWFSVGLAGLGFVLSLLFVAKGQVFRKPGH